MPTPRTRSTHSPLGDGPGGLVNGASARLQGTLAFLIAALLVASCLAATPPGPPTSPPGRPTMSTTESPEPLARDLQAPTATSTVVPPTSSAPTATPTPIPTLAALPVGVISTYEGPPSPDGRWLVRHLAHDAVVDVPTDYGEHPFLYHSQSLAATDGSITHTFRTAWIPDGLGGTWPQFLGWAPDSSAAFVYMGGSPDGCALSGWSENVWRVSVSGGEATVLGAVPGTPSLSPDARWLGGVGRVGQTDAEFEWIDVETGERGRSTFPIPNADDGAPGEVVAPRWSPDGSAIVVRVAYGACSDAWREVLVYHELGTSEGRVILENDEGDRFLWIEDWLPDDTLVVTDRPPWFDESDDEPPVWHIDARTGEER